MILSRLTLSQVLLHLFGMAFNEDCRKNFVGSRCQLPCHCQFNECKEDASCTDDNLCEPGYFGPGCQYVDLIVTKTAPSTPEWLKDTDDTTCNPSFDELAELVIQLEVSDSNSFPLGWCRVVLNRPDIGNLTLKPNGNTCPHLQKVALGNNTWDLYCGWNYPVDRLIFAGNSVRDICTVYASLGRRIAINTKNVTQTSTASPFFMASRAIDGDIEGDFCATTDPTEEDIPVWTISFTFPHIIHSFAIVTKAEGGPPYSFQGRNWKGDLVYTTQFFIDSGKMVSVSSFIPYHISSVAIAPLSHKKGQMMELCEVKLWGEALCPEGYWGLECNNSCQCENPLQLCAPSTGDCLGPCPKGYYGLYCSLSCPIGCMDNCLPASGKCLGCLPGYLGEGCERTCDPGWYGPSCIETCPENCHQHTCEHTSGYCQDCEHGFLTPSCKKDCDKQVQNCSERCSPQCHTCFDAPSTCTSCNEGFVLPFCQPPKEDAGAALTTMHGVPSFGLAVTVCIIFFALMGGSLVFFFITPRDLLKSVQSVPVKEDTPGSTSAQTGQQLERAKGQQAGESIPLHSNSGQLFSVSESYESAQGEPEEMDN